MTADRLTDLDVPRVVLLVLTLVVVGAFLAGGVTSGVSFAAFNQNWDGTSELRTTATDVGSEPVIVQNTTRYDAYAQNDVAFVLAPEQRYGDADRRRVRAFVERGGTLVVAEREGAPGHALLEGIGADARPNGTVLRDARRHYRSPAFPVAENVSEQPLVDGVESVTMNHGTAVEPNGATVLVTSSETAYLDADADSSLSENETLAAYPIVTVESIGSGRVVVVGDPSVFINVMQAETNNDAFTAALLEDTDHALVDVSHASSPPPLVAVVLAIRNSVALQVGVGAAGLTLVGVCTRLVGRRDDAPRPAVDDADLPGGLQRLYPDLDVETVERLTQGVLSDRSQSSDDE